MPISPQFLADLNAAWAPFDAGAAAAGYGSGPAPAAPMVSGTPLAPVAPPPNPTGYPALGDVPPAPANDVAPPGPGLAKAGPPPPPPGMSLPTDDPNALASRPPPNMSQGPAAVPSGAEPAPKAPAPPPMPPDVQFAPVATPGAPAREVSMRGPKQEGLLQASFEPGQEAANRISLRSQLQAQHDADYFDAQAERYMQQQAAMEAAAAKRAQQLEALHNDYMSTVQQLGSAKIDNDRLWANSSTLDKIGAVLLTVLGGLGGGTNGVLQTINNRIQADVDTQKFDYENLRNQANAKHTAYAMAVDRYGSEDAARNAAIAAGQLAVASKIRGMESQWKGVDAQNQADMLIAQLQQGALKSASDGFRFVQATPGGQRYVMSFRGQVAPGTFSEAQAQTHFLEHGTKPAENVDMEMVKGGIHVAGEAQKAAIERGAYGPMGKAGSEKMATEQAEAQRERDAMIGAMNHEDFASKNIARGGAIGTVMAKTLPASFPGVTKAVKDMNAREAYNTWVKMTVAGMYKLSTDAAEPKNTKAIEDYAGPYLVPSTANEAVVDEKKALLARAIDRAALAKGAKSPPLPEGVRKAAW